MLAFLPNLITLCRFACVPVFVFFLFQYSVEPGNHLLSSLRTAQAIFVLASLSDAIDGVIARRFKIKSRLGSFLDPLADKALVLAGFFVLALLQPPGMPYLPIWFALLVLFKDSVLVLGVSWARIQKIYMEVRPHWTSKVSTFLQMATITAALFQIPANWFAPMLYLSALLILTSTLVYFMQGIQLLRARRYTAITN